VYVGEKKITELKILGCELHTNALPRPLAAIRGRKEKIGKGREGKGVKK